MANAVLITSLSNLLWVFGASGSLILVIISTRFRIHIRSRRSNVGTIILDTFIFHTFFLTVALGMVIIEQYTSFTVPLRLWLATLFIWFTIVWLSIGRFLYWYIHKPVDRLEDALAVAEKTVEAAEVTVRVAKDSLAIAAEGEQDDHEHYS